VPSRVLRPPYCYRWAVLITALFLLLTFVRDLQSAAAGPDAESAAAGPPPALNAQAVAVSADLVRHTAHTGPVVALTFDDGPHPKYTPQILALLTRYRAVGTFCMVGSMAARYPDLVRQVVTAGMRLCDHSVTHSNNLPALPKSRIDAEIVGGKSELLAAAGQQVSVDYFRAPAGRWSDSVRHIAARHGMMPLSWSVDPRDWSRPGTELIVARVKRSVHPGAIILLHDGGGRRDQTVAALSQLLPWLVEHGYGFDVP
jgi:peptidoglycan-N-acetylglucosamine deacetylase